MRALTRTSSAAEMIGDSPSMTSETAASVKIPGYETIAAVARQRNPSGRMTLTEDVARAIVVLTHPDTYWMTGNVIGVDGGEDIVG